MRQCQTERRSSAAGSGVVGQCQTDRQTERERGKKSIAVINGVLKDSLHLVCCRSLLKVKRHLIPAKSLVCFFMFMKLVGSFREVDLCF